MRGLMQDWPLLIPSLIEHAARYHGDEEIVSRSVEGPIHRCTYRDVSLRAKRLANALQGLGARPGDRIATLAWNGYRHLELYFAVPGIGAVCHTVNPRLFDEQIVFIINHAGDRYLFLDLSFVPLVERIAPKLASVEGYVIMTDRDHMPESALANLLCYEELIGGHNADHEWPKLDERDAAGLCYTSGTTGDPKGALYSHRAILLHTFFQCSTYGLGISNRDTAMPVVPMFHANSWGIPHVATMCGARQIYPGPKVDGASLYELIEAERVTFAAGVPTVWLGLLEFLKQSGNRFTTLERALIGGSATPRSMIETLEAGYGVEVTHAWGMTEMTPVGTTGILKKKHLGLPDEARRDKKLHQGRAVYGVELKIVDEEGNELARDGKAAGRLLVRGPWIVSAYYNSDENERFSRDGWFDTGDVATLDEDGYMTITDRSKDVIKSGGEWISSIFLENTAMGHPGVAEAGAIAVPHPKWGERPLLVVVRAKGSKVGAQEILDYMRDKVAKWQLPDEVVFVDEIPHTATGKISKKTLRERFAEGGRACARGRT
ncbi:MAG: 3-(methylthio)propionyl-CoA ligase [Proteobacteria bacterium]|nr:3-(methylthio)propionyl-CoA ligase [Pseudomonadota bacterium]